MLVSLYNTHPFYAIRYKLVHWRIQQADVAAAQGSLVYTNSTGRGGTADDRVIKEQLHPRHQAGRRVTVHPFRLLLITIIYYVAGVTQRLQRRRFSLVTNVVAITRMHTGCESSRKFLEAQVISSSLDGWTVAWRPAWWGWMELCFNHPVICCSSSLPYYSHVPPLPMLFVYRHESCAAAAACYIRQWTSLYRVA